MSDVFAPLRERAARVRGVHGFAVLDERGEPLLTERADELFPAASVIKLPLVMALHADAAAGRISLDERLETGARVGGSGILAHLRDVGSFTLRDLAMLTIALSDNTATNLLTDRVGIERVNERMREWGYERSVFARKMFDAGAKASGRENLMTPGETARMLLRLARGECHDRATSDAVLALLRAGQKETFIRRYLPDGVDVSHKSGWIAHVRNDAAIVRVSRPIIAVGFLKELDDDNAGPPLLGILGWCAYRAAGADVAPLPPELGAGA